MMLWTYIWSFVLLRAASFTRSVAKQTQQPLSPDPATQRIAIIGAGAAGSSAAYHLAQFANEADLQLKLDITVFDTNSIVGGRTTTVNVLDIPDQQVELGASIFVEINHILFNATQNFGLTPNRRIYESTGAKYDLGVWDGTSFVFTTIAHEDGDDGLSGRLSGWWDIAKLLWKYGLSPIRLQSLQKDIIGRFLRLYDDYFPFPDLTAAAEEANLLDATGTIGYDFLNAAGAAGSFASDIVQASTRVNYAQNLGAIHGLEALVCMSTDGAMSVAGGNWQIFDHMIKKSGANLHLNTTVSAITTLPNGETSLTYSPSTSPSEQQTQLFDSILLAAPYHQSQITFTPPLSPTPENTSYVSLHVTLFTTRSRPSPASFNLPADAESLVPDSILTTVPPKHGLGSRHGPHGLGPHHKFWSLSTLRSLPLETCSDPNPCVTETHYLYKIFSPAPLTAHDMAHLFAWDLPDAALRNDTVAALPEEFVSWSHEKTWLSYPYLPPRRTFEAFRLVQQGAQGADLWYTSPIESFISTMETSALAGRNVARLIVDGLLKGGKGRMNAKDEL